jgi:lipase chaperone LimK
MFSLFSSFTSSPLQCEEQQSRAHDITRSDTSTDTVSTPEEGEQKVAELEQKQDEVEEEEDEEVEDVRQPSPVRSRGRRGDEEDRVALALAGDAGDVRRG